MSEDRTLSEERIEELLKTTALVIHLRDAEGGAAYFSSAYQEWEKAATIDTFYSALSELKRARDENARLRPALDDAAKTALMISELPVLDGAARGLMKAAHRKWKAALDTTHGD